MNLEYDLDVDALYVRLAVGEVTRTRQLDCNTLIDLDADGNVLGIEVLAVAYPWALPEVLAMDGISEADKADLRGYFMPPLVPVVSVST